MRQHFFKSLIGSKKKVPLFWKKTCCFWKKTNFLKEKTINFIKLLGYHILECFIFRYFLRIFCVFFEFFCWILMACKNLTEGWHYFNNVTKLSFFAFCWSLLDVFCVFSTKNVHKFEIDKRKNVPRKFENSTQENSTL